jgi:hypothetical protein
MKTMGQQFREARERKQLSLSRAASITRVKIQHLERMEEDDFSQMPAPAYAKGFIKMYAELLDLDPGPLVEEYIEVHLEGTRRIAEPPPLLEEPAADDGTGQASTDRGPAWPKGFKLPSLSARQIQAWLPHLARGGAAVLVLLVVVAGLNRCLGSSDDGDTPVADAPARLDRAHLLAEPPPPYLPTPKAGPDVETPSP